MRLCDLDKDMIPEREGKVNMENEIKQGARHSVRDQQLIQDIHDKALELGAVLPQTDFVGAPKSIEPDETFVAYGGEVKAMGDGKVGGILARFTPRGDYDLTQDRFAPVTDFGEADKLPVLYHHGMDAKVGRRRIGTGRLEKQDVGLWVEAQLNLRDEYEKAIYELANDGKLSWSSGAAAHTVVREHEGKGALITQWYLSEASLTPSPAEPRNMAMTLKSLIELEATTVAASNLANAPQAEPQADAKTDAAQAASATKGTNIPEAATAAVEDSDMDEKQFAEMQENIKKLMDAQLAKIAELESKIDAPALTPAPGVQVPNIKTVTERGFANDEIKSFLHWVRTGDETAYKAAMQGQTDSEGGFAVPDDFYSQIVAKRNETSVMRQAGAQFFPTSLDRVLVPTEGTAATKFVVTAEEGAYDENEPTLGQSIITVHKMTKLIKISEELEGDAKANFGGWLSNVWGRAMALAENYYFCNVAANGSSQPASVTYGATAGTAVASQTATTAAELLTNIYAIPSAYSDKLAMVMRRATLGAMRALTGNPFAFIPTPQGSGGADTTGQNAGFIHGIPVYVTDELPAQAAANKPIVIFNPDFYLIAEREGMTVQRNPWLYQANGQIGLFAKFREGGVLTQALAAITVVSKT